jgi:pimeloyl-ACP methyl ester carboxylesterase
VRSWTAFCSVATLIVGLQTAVGAQTLPAAPTPREIAHCGEQERDLFQTWSKVAGTSTEQDALASAPGAEMFDIPMADGRVIRGVRIRGSADTRRFVLVIPGNAWLAKNFAPYGAGLSSGGFDVYIPDFRGYGLSQPGIPTMNAIVADYREIAAWIWSQGYDDGYLYAFSFGGVVAAAAFSDDTKFKRIVLDAVPSRPIARLKLTCSINYDPVDRLPADCHNMVVMHGTSDWVVRRRGAQEFLNKAEACGALLDTGKRRGHPFQIEWQSTKQRRLQDVINYLAAP